MKKHKIAVAIAIAMMGLSSCEFSSLNNERSVSQEYTEESVSKYTDEKYFAFDEETQTILDYDISGGVDIVIPETINGVKVLEIGDVAFSKKGIESVVIPEGIRKIGMSAFANNNIS